MLYQTARTRLYPMVQGYADPAYEKGELRQRGLRGKGVPWHTLVLDGAGGRLCVAWRLLHAAYSWSQPHISRHAPPLTHPHLPSLLRSGVVRLLQEGAGAPEAQGGVSACRACMQLRAPKWSGQGGRARGAAAYGAAWRLGGHRPGCVG